MKNINFHTGVKVQNKLWFVTIDGYLMTYDVVKKQSEVIVPENIFELEFGHIVDNMFYHNGSIYFVEQDGNLLYEYSLSENYCYCYEMPKLKMVNWGCFSGIYLINGSIYFFTKAEGKTVIFDTDTKRISEEKTNNTTDLKCSVKIDDSIYFIGDRKVIKYSIKENKFTREYSVDLDIKWAAAYASKIYLLTADNCIYVSDTEFSELDLLYDSVGSIQTVVRFVITKNYVYALPSTVGDYLVIDKKTKDVKKAVLPKDLKYEDIAWGKYVGYCEDERTIWLANRMCNYTIYIDKESETINFYVIPDDDRGNIKRLKWKKVISENELSLEQFLTDYIWL